jgi:hypothetical protein
MRGIDLAFIYARDLFDIETTLDDAGIVKNRVFHHVIQKPNATRDLVPVNFKTKQGNTFIVIGNHFPSRIGGEIDSQPYRTMVGETLSYFLDRIKEIRGEIAVLSTEINSDDLPLLGLIFDVIPILLNKLSNQ